MRHIILSVFFLAGLSFGIPAYCADHVEISNIPEHNSCLENLPIEMLRQIIQHLEPDSLNCFILINKNVYKSYISTLEATRDIIDENLAHDYRDWSGIDIFTPQRKFWVNSNFLELLALSINLKSNRWCQMDIERFDRICWRFFCSSLPRNSMVLQYVKFLSNETALFERLSKFFCSLPDFTPFLAKPGFDNEKALYLFHTYLQVESPNIQGLKQDPLYTQVDGAMGNFIRSQEELHPIRQKMKRGELLQEKNISMDLFETAELTDKEIRCIILQDPGMTRQCMADILVTSIKRNNTYGASLDAQCLRKLSMFVIKYDISSNSSFNRDLLEFYEKHATPKIYADLLHFSLCSKQPSLIGRRNYHRKAIEKFEELEQIERVRFHQEKLLFLMEEINGTKSKKDAFFYSLNYRCYR